MAVGLLLESKNAFFLTAATQSKNKQLQRLSLYLNLVKLQTRIRQVGDLLMFLKGLQMVQMTFTVRVCFFICLDKV